VLGSDGVQQTIERVAKIKHYMLAAESRQNSYDDSKRIDECEILWRPVRWYF
jgi:hypothetical protein